MQNDHEILMKKKADFFFNNKRAVHIRHKDKHFSNGTIIDRPTYDFIILKEFVIGEVPIFFMEMVDMVEFTNDSNKEERKDGTK